MDNPQVLYLWKAPLRPYKKRSTVILRFYLAVALLLSLIVFFFGDKILLVPIWSLLFLFYTLTITPPPVVENKITKFGIDAAGVTVRWEALSYFFFGHRFGFDTVTIVSHAPYFYHFYLVFPDEKVKKEVGRFLAEHLIFQEKPQKTITDRLSDWLSQLIPEDEPSIPPSASPLPQTVAPNK